MITLFDNETILKGYTREKVNVARAEEPSEGMKLEKIVNAKNLLKE